jgi:hypothetical protein
MIQGQGQRVVCVARAGALCATIRRGKSTLSFPIYEIGLYEAAARHLAARRCRAWHAQGVSGRAERGVGRRRSQVCGGGRYPVPASQARAARRSGRGRQRLRLRVLGGMGMRLSLDTQFTCVSGHARKEETHECA